ncbi:MAG: T9SS type A sorting domain-containing protein [Ignavibacteriaceae bacterium]|nr:T9SS type A sorting domain-containing protein [Ignavibacteriaceae bacterium]
MIKKLLLFFTLLTSLVLAQNYQGVQNCQMCHSGALRTYPGFTNWQATLHSKIHLAPSAETMKGNYSSTVSMGASYGNATVTFRVDGSNYFVQLNPVGASQVEYPIAYTYGGGWKQRYLVKIENSYYMPPVQWNLNKYKDNTSGAWVSYNPQNWFTSTGALKPLDNAFRTKSWDKNCAGCHVVPGNHTNTVNKVVNGNDTAWVYSWANSSSLSNIVVGCESCHGHPSAFAGAGHVNNLTSLSYDRKLEVCGQCHFRGKSSAGTHEFPYDEATGKTYKAGEVLAGYIIEAPGLWPDGKSSKQHHQQNQDYKYSKHFNSNFGITCVTCHDPHQETAYPHQLKEDFNSMSAGVGCIKCHGDKAAETNGRNNHSKHLQSMSQCVNCHMQQTAVTAKSYDISSHSFTVIRPNATNNFSTVTNGMINTCAAACHRNGQGTRGFGPNFSITDASLTNWAEATDLALADTLWKYYQVMYGIVDVKQENSNIPSSFSLEQNYPNPFNPTTTIRFAVAKQSNVRLEVYSVDGQLVNILINKELAPGTYTSVWDSKSVTGLTVPSGIYLYRLTAGDNVVMTKKMVLLK